MALHHRRTQGDVFGYVRSCLLILRERQYSGHIAALRVCTSKRHRLVTGLSARPSTDVERDAEVAALT